MLPALPALKPQSISYSTLTNMTSQQSQLTQRVESLENQLKTSQADLVTLHTSLSSTIMTLNSFLSEKS